MICPIPPRNTFGKDNCAYWEGFLTDSELHYLCNNQNWNNPHTAYIGGPGSDNMIIDKNVRSTQVSWLFMDQENRYIWEKISKIISEVNSRYFQYDLTGCYEPMQLGIYKADEHGHYDWHTDASVKDRITPRKLSMVLMLSDPSEFEGGLLQTMPISDDIMTLEQARGRAWFFPSYMIHRVTPVTKGVRKSLVMWIGGPQFK